MKVPFPVRAVPAFTLRAWFTPPPLPKAAATRDRHETGDLTPVYFGGLPGYEIGSGPLVVAVHGWGGRCAQMAPIARHLAAEGHRVVIPTLPGGAGAGPTDLKEVAASLRAVVDDVGWPQMVVAHSFAAMVLRLVFLAEAPPRVTLIAPALDVNDALAVFGERLRLLPWARRALRRGLQNWDPSLWPMLSSIHPSQLPGAEVLIVHDPADEDTPFARSAELAALRPQTSIVALEQTGHSRILAESDLLDLVAAFATDRAISGDTAA